MKLKFTIVLLALSFVTLVACNKDEKNNSPEFKNVTYTPTAEDQIIAQGVFGKVDSSIDIAGLVKVYKNPDRQVLRFENFMVDNGPKLKVYLSPSVDDISGNINLGDLIAASGNFNYVFSVNTNTSTHRFVLIYSEESNSIYGYAEIL